MLKKSAIAHLWWLFVFWLACTPVYGQLAIAEPILPDHIDTLHPVYAVPLAKGIVTDVAWSSDSKQLAFVQAGQVKVYDLENQQFRILPDFNAYALNCRFAPTQSLIAVNFGPISKGVALYDLEKERISWLSHESADEFVFSPDGAVIVTASSSEVRVWDLTSLDLVQTWQPASSDDLVTLTFNPDGNTLWTFHRAATYQWTWQDNRAVIDDPVKINQEGVPVGFYTNDTLMLLETGDAISTEFHVVSPQGMSSNYQSPTTAEGIPSTDVLYQADVLVMVEGVYSMTNALTFYRWSDGQKLHTIKSQAGMPFTQVQFSPDGLWLATISSSHSAVPDSIQLWSVGS